MAGCRALSPLIGALDGQGDGGTASVDVAGGSPVSVRFAGVVAESFVTIEVTNQPGGSLRVGRVG